MIENGQLAQALDHVQEAEEQLFHAKRRVRHQQSDSFMYWRLRRAMEELEAALRELRPVVSALEWKSLTA